MKLDRIILEHLKINNGSVLVPDPLIFSTREDAVYFGDSRRISADISTEKYSSNKMHFIYKKIMDDKKIWKK